MNKEYFVCGKMDLRRYVNIGALMLASAGLLLAGCGGGAGASIAGDGASVDATPFAPAPTYTDSRANFPDAISRSFTPNYASALEVSGVWQGRTLLVYFPAESEGIVTQSLQRWKDATGGFFHWERVASADEAQVTFKGVDPSEFKSGNVGRTQYTYNIASKELISAQVTYSISGDEADQIPIVVHELGHVLGIHGHSDSVSDIMYPSVARQGVISTKDLNTLFWLYRDTVDGVVSPGRSVSIDKQVTNSISCPVF